MGERDMLTQDRHWHLDRKVPIALIIALIVQTFGLGWWAASTDGRVSTLEKRMDAAAPQADRLTRVEVKIETVQSGIDEIKQLIRGRATTPN